MSSISAGTTTGTALVNAGDTTGALVFKTNGTTTALTLDTSQNATFVGDLITPVLKGTKEMRTAIPASDIDLSTGNYFTKTISGTTTFTVSNVATSGDVSAFILQLTNGGSATVNWFTGVDWPSATPPTLTASGVDVLGFFTHDGGTTWYGFVLGQAMA